MPSPATLCPRGKGAALGQRDQKSSRAGRQAPGLTLRNSKLVVFLTLQNGNDV